MSVSESEKRKIELGPLFTSGVVVFAYGLLRRRRLAFVIGDARARPDGAPPAHLALTDSGRTGFLKRFATEGATRSYYLLRFAAHPIDALGR